MKKLLLIFSLFLLLVSSCDDPFMNKSYIEQSNEDVDLSNAMFLKKNKATFSLFIELLKYADMYNALNDANTVSTIFAPNNEAMKKFLAWKGVDSVSELSKEYARNVAQVHILKYDLGESVFINYVDAGSIPITTVFGNYLTTSYGFKNINIDDSGLDTVKVQDPLSMYLNNEAKVESLAKTTANGEVYELSGVIHPLSECIPEILELQKGYSIFLEALKITGYKDTLNVYADTACLTNGSKTINDIKYTCFAVPDSIYKSSGINSIAGLETYLKSGSDYLSQSNTLNKYVAYHLMDGSFTKDKLFTFQEDGQVVLYDTKLTSEVLSVQKSTSGEIINGTISILRSGIKARNGYIHKVSDIMPVYIPKPVTVRWDFCNSSDIISFVNSYGAKYNYGEVFSIPLSAKDYQVDLSNDKRDGNYGTITSFTYLSNEAKSPYSSFRKVGFYKCPYLSSNKKTENKYGAFMDNLMFLNLGFAGWFQSKSPTIVKGKYKVVLYYAGSPALKSFYTTGSLTKFNLDDYQKSVYLWKGLPDKFVLASNQSNANAYGIASDVIWDSVEFSKSEGHTLKATMMDINAKTNVLYRQMWDYIEFVPVTE
jgi:uncharacterized surface protein with fasciclin (FAS1) repeats